MAGITEGEYNKCTFDGLASQLYAFLLCAEQFQRTQACVELKDLWKVFQISRRLNGILLV
jgi:hypothetical protein